MKFHIIKQKDSIYEYRWLEFECKSQYWEEWRSENARRRYANIRTGEETWKVFDVDDTKALWVISLEHIIEFLKFVNTILPEKSLTTNKQFI